MYSFSLITCLGLLILPLSIKGENQSTIIITCASGELGSEIARDLSKDHALIMTGRNKTSLEMMKQELEAMHPFHYEVCLLDYTDPASISAFEKKLHFLESLDGLVLITPRPAHGQNLLQEEAKWLQLFQCTFTGPAAVLSATIPFIRAGGKIVVIGGTTSVQLMPAYGPSCIIRRMWTTYSKALAHQLGPQGISINVLSPGVVFTDFHLEKITKLANENELSFQEQLSKLTACIPLQKYTTRQEVAQCVRFLLSKESNGLTGINMVLDGGETTSY